jgi:ribonuclease HI
MEKYQGSDLEQDRRYRVFVDATIEDRHVVAGRTFVAYVVEGSQDLQKVSQIEDAHESDDAELQAIAFAIRELKDRLRKFTILCDNEGVVSQILRGEIKPSSRPVLGEILSEIRVSKSSINVELFINLADKLLTAYQAELEKQQSSND